VELLNYLEVGNVVVVGNVVSFDIWVVAGSTLVGRYKQDKKQVKTFGCVGFEVTVYGMRASDLDFTTKYSLKL